MSLIDKKLFLKKFSTRKDAIAAILFFEELINSGIYNPLLISSLKDELIAEDENDLPQQVIDYLNQITKSNFRHLGHIQRICKKRPNVTLDQFKSVILFKNEKWGGDEKMSQYLTPATLFGSERKFLGYLDEATNHWIKKAKDAAMREALK